MEKSEAIRIITEEMTYEQRLFAERLCRGAMVVPGIHDIWVLSYVGSPIKNMFYDVYCIGRRNTVTGGVDSIMWATRENTAVCTAHVNVQGKTIKNVDDAIMRTFMKYFIEDVFSNEEFRKELEEKLTEVKQ